MTRSGTEGLQVLKQNQKALSSTFVLNRKWSGWGWAMKWAGLDHERGVADLLPSVLVLVMSTALNVSVVGLERALLQYCSQPQEEAFDMKTVPIDTAPFNKNRMECKLFLLPHPFLCSYV